MFGKPERPMKFPYTFSAKIAQFPYMYYFRNQPYVKYYLAAIVLTIPLMYKINKMVNSPENVALWAEKKKKEREEHKH